MPLHIPTARPIPSVSGSAHQVRESRPSDVVTSRIAAPFSTHGTERSMPPMSTTNVCPAATKPTNEAVSRIAFTLAGAREAGVEDVADDEDEHHRAEGEDHAQPVGRQERRQLRQPARPRLRLRAHLATPTSRPTRAPRTTATTRNRPWNASW